MPTSPNTYNRVVEATCIVLLEWHMNAVQSKAETLTSKLAISVAHWWMDGLLMRKPSAPTARSISVDEWKRVQTFGQHDWVNPTKAYLVSFGIGFHRGCPTNRRGEDIVSQSVSNVRKDHQCSRHWNSSTCKYTRRQSPHSSRVTSAGHCQRHGPNPNPRHIPE